MWLWLFGYLHFVQYSVCHSVLKDSLYRGSGNEKYFPCQSNFRHKFSFGESVSKYGVRRFTQYYYRAIQSCQSKVLLFWNNFHMLFKNKPILSCCMENTVCPQQQLAPSPTNQRRQMAPVMAKPVMLPQSQTSRPDPHRPALRSDGLVRNTAQSIHLCPAQNFNSPSEGHLPFRHLTQWGINLCVFSESSRLSTLMTLDICFFFKRVFKHFSGTFRLVLTELPI